MLMTLLSLIGAALLVAGTIVLLVIAVVAGFLATLGVICIVGNLVVHFVKRIIGD